MTRWQRNSELKRDSLCRVNPTTRQKGEIQRSSLVRAMDKIYFCLWEQFLPHPKQYELVPDPGYNSRKTTLTLTHVLNEWLFWPKTHFNRVVKWVRVPLFASPLTPITIPLTWRPPRLMPRAPPLSITNINQLCWRIFGYFEVCIYQQCIYHLPRGLRLTAVAVI